MSIPFFLLPSPPALPLTLSPALLSSEWLQKERTHLKTVGSRGTFTPPPRTHGWAAIPPSPLSASWPSTLPPPLPLTH